MVVGWLALRQAPRLAVRPSGAFLQSLVEARFPHASEIDRSPVDDTIEIRVRYSQAELARAFSDEAVARRVLRDVSPRARKPYRPNFRVRKFRR